MVKRIFDLIFATIILIISLPLFLIIPILIKLDSKGPIIFKHKRIGKDGKEIMVYKFRTMIKDAHIIGPELTEKNDSRITRVGKFLRKSSLDELPQFINVIKGDMSIVGPRPEIPSIVKTYSNFQKQVLKVKPGITGLSQVNGRADLSIPQKLRLDVYYVKHQNIWLDIKIICKTIFIVLSQKGAF
jgi:exopolysaccharide biosynthesis polyprenyl glycosylphosphotransferase